MSALTHPYPGSPLGDIVVLVAGDVSMTPVVDALGDVAVGAISKGVQAFPLDVSMSIFSVGTDAFPGKLPSPTLKSYLVNPPPMGVGAPAGQVKEHDPVTPPPDYNYDMENAIIDACALFDWRNGTKQAILLLANEWPNGGGQAAGTSILADVKTAARYQDKNPVLVFTGLTPPPTNKPLSKDVATEYRNLALSGGTYTDLTAPSSLETRISDVIQRMIGALAMAWKSH